MSRRSRDPDRRKNIYRRTSIAGTYPTPGLYPSERNRYLEKQENVEQRRRATESEKEIDHTTHIIPCAEEYIKEDEATGRNIAKIE